LRREGKKKNPFYHVVVMDSRNRRDGRCIEQIGTYGPLVNQEEKFFLNKDKASDWLKKGARPSQTVRGIFVRAGIIDKAVAQK